MAYDDWFNQLLAPLPCTPGARLDRLHSTPCNRCSESTSSRRWQRRRVPAAELLRSVPGPRRRPALARCACRCSARHVPIRSLLRPHLPCPAARAVAPRVMKLNPAGLCAVRDEAKDGGGRSSERGPLPDGSRQRRRPCRCCPQRTGEWPSATCGCWCAMAYCCMTRLPAPPRWRCLAVLHRIVLQGKAIESAVSTKDAHVAF